MWQPGWEGSLGENGYMFVQDTSEKHWSDCFRNADKSQQGSADSSPVPNTILRHWQRLLPRALRPVLSSTHCPARVQGPVPAQAAPFFLWLPVTVSAREDGGVSGVSSSCGARGGFLPRPGRDWAQEEKGTTEDEMD